CYGEAPCPGRLLDGLSRHGQNGQVILRYGLPLATRWATTMSGPPLRSADRNLLFGILALQMDFISRDALIEAMNAWVLDKTRSLGQILLAQGRLAPERLQLLESLVHEHLKAHGDDPQRSLAAVGQALPVRP